MPIYEYECSACGAHFEKLIRVAGDIPEKCERCGAKKIKKAFSAFSVGSASSATTTACETCPSSEGGGCPMSGRCAGGACGLE